MTQRRPPQYLPKTASDPNLGERSHAPIPAWARVELPEAISGKSRLGRPQDRRGGLHNLARIHRLAAVLSKIHDLDRDLADDLSNARSRSAGRGARAAQNRPREYSSINVPLRSGAEFQPAPVPLLTVSDAAFLLAVSVKTIRRLIERGELPSVRIGRAIRIRPVDLQALIERRVP